MFYTILYEIQEEMKLSRVGKQPVDLPKGVTVNLDKDNVVTVKGPLGTLQRSISDGIEVNIQNGVLYVTRPNDLRKFKMLHGLNRTLIHNMVVGVTSGYKKSLEIHGVGYRATKTENNLILTLGYSHPVVIADPDGISTSVEQNIIVVSGIDKEKVGQHAANIKHKRAVEPYKGKGIRYLGENVRRKLGKSGKK
jgi:large subunit ribosomal protein L6